ncbi:hypothetical protein CEXT_140931, partial [Caerostris extrusa]
MYGHPDIPVSNLMTFKFRIPEFKSEKTSSLVTSKESFRKSVILKLLHNAVIRTVHCLTTILLNHGLRIEHLISVNLPYVLLYAMHSGSKEYCHLV